MPSKRIDFYAFVAEGYELEIRKADAGNKDKPDVKKTIDGKAPLTITKESHEIQTAYLGTKYEGRFQFIARKNGKQLFERSIRVNAHTGNIVDEDIQNLKIPSPTDSEYNLSFGLYDSDSGTLAAYPDLFSQVNLNPFTWGNQTSEDIKSGKITPLTNGHQFYATLTPPMNEWQKEIFDAYKKKHGNNAFNSLAFSKFFLPGSHDAGMYINLPGPISDFANTQRESTQKQLQLGARYFDFRPGKIKPGYKEAFEKFERENKSEGPFKQALEFIKMAVMLKSAAVLQAFVGEIRHIHAIIPGETFHQFIAEIITFLNTNKQEIVVVQLMNNGFISDTIIETPTKTALLNEIQDLLKNTSVKIGGKARLKDTVKNILDADERLIILFREDNANFEDTYKDDGNQPTLNYQSLNAEVITNNFNRINFSNDGNNDYFKFQHQLTANAVTGAILRVITSIPGRSPVFDSTANIFLSPLWSTKPAADRKSYEWMLTRLNYTSRNLLLVGINDFYDNAFTQVAKTITRMRLELFDIYAAGKDTLQNDARLNKGDSMVSANKHYQLIFQEDGNLVMYNLARKAVWSSDTALKGGKYAIMQQDGNLVIYSEEGNKGVVWSIHAQVDKYEFSRNALLKIQDDGNLVIYSNQNKVIWARQS